MYILNTAILRWLRDAYVTFLHSTHWPGAPFITQLANRQNCWLRSQHQWSIMLTTWCLWHSTCWERCCCEAQKVQILNSLDGKCPYGMVLNSVVGSDSQHHFVAHSKTFDKTTSGRGVFCWEQQSHQAKEVATQHGWLLPRSTYLRFPSAGKYTSKATTSF